MGRAAQSSPIAANALIYAFEMVGVRFALEVLCVEEDFAVALLVVGGVSELRAARKRPAQRARHLKR